MAGKNDIKAGSAFVELFLKDKLTRQVTTTVANVGGIMAGAGAAMAAAGAAILAPLAASVKHFVGVGSALTDMSARTGVAVDELSILKYAAEQTGATLEDVEAAIRNLEKKGIDPSNLNRIAEELKAIPDPAKRAAMAIEQLGKAGTKILPALLALKELRAQAIDLGLVVTPKQAAAADRLGDALDDFRKVVLSTAIAIGTALEPVITPMVQTMTAIAVAVAKFAKEHPHVVKIVAAIAVAMIAFGTAAAVLGLAAIKIGALVTAIAAVVASWGAIVAALAVAAKIMAVVIVVMAAVSWLAIMTTAWLVFTKSGQRALAAMKKDLADFGAFATKVFGSIADALRGGDIELAWDIVIQTMKLSWVSFVATIKKDITDLAAGLAFDNNPAFFGSGKPGDALIKAITGGDAEEIRKAAFELVRLQEIARNRAAAAGTQTDNPSSPGYGMPKYNAATIGTNARSALMSRQVIGGGRNATNDLLSKILLQTAKAGKLLESINRAKGALR